MAVETSDLAAVSSCALRLHHRTKAVQAVVKHAGPVEEAQDVRSLQAALPANSAVRALLVEAVRRRAFPGPR